MGREGKRAGSPVHGQCIDEVDKEAGEVCLPCLSQGLKAGIGVGELGKGKSKTFGVRFGQFRYFRPSNLSELHV